MTVAALKDSISINGHELYFFIDETEADEYQFKIVGWAFLRGVNSWEVDCKIDFKGKHYNFSLKPDTLLRHDVTLSQNKSFNYDESGFLIRVPIQYVGADLYEIYLTFKKKGTNEVIASYPFLGIKVV